MSKGGAKGGKKRAQNASKNALIADQATLKGRDTDYEDDLEREADYDPSHGGDTW
jgi:hypothetical protein